jgi:hypothetical protein
MVKRLHVGGQDVNVTEGKSGNTKVKAETSNEK